MGKQHRELAEVKNITEKNTYVVFTSPSIIQLAVFLSLKIRRIGSFCILPYKYFSPTNVYSHMKLMDIYLLNSCKVWYFPSPRFHFARCKLCGAEDRTAVALYKKKFKFVGLDVCRDQRIGVLKNVVAPYRCDLEKENRLTNNDDICCYLYIVF